MTTTNSIPDTVMNGSPKDKRLYFKRKILKHPKQVQCFNDALRAIADSDTDSSKITMIVGPTGAGKSKLVKRLEKALLDEFQLGRPAPSAIPYLSIEPISAVRDNFDWALYFSQLLMDANEPLIDRKKLAASKTHEESLPEAIKKLPKTAAGLAQAFIHCALARLILAILVDEAQHFTKVAGSRRLLDQMDLLKSVANLTQVPHILVGTYDLLALHNLNGQLGRRVELIHFGRYKSEVREDRQAFRSIVYSLQHHLPLPTVPDLAGRLDLMLEGSQGCVGILKDWLAKALKLALQQDAPTLTDAILEQTAYSGQTLGRIRNEIREGEEQLALQPGDVDLTVYFGKKAAIKAANKPKRKGNRRPGIRNPVRDKVGMEDD